MPYISKLDKQLATRTFRVKASSDVDADPDSFIGVEIVGPEEVEEVYVLDEVIGTIRRMQEEIDEIQAHLDVWKALKQKMRDTIDAAKPPKVTRFEAISVNDPVNINIV